MAITSITNTSLKFNEAKAMPSTTAIDGTAGCRIDFSKCNDGGLLVILENASSSAAATATIKAGNSVQGVNDLSVSLTASQTKVITVESGKYMNVTGTDKGYVVIKGTNIKAAAIELP